MAAQQEARRNMDLFVECQLPVNVRVVACKSLLVYSCFFVHVLMYKRRTRGGCVRFG